MEGEVDSFSWLGSEAIKGIIGSSSCSRKLVQVASIGSGQQSRESGINTCCLVHHGWTRLQRDAFFSTGGIDNAVSQKAGFTEY